MGGCINCDAGGSEVENYRDDQGHWCRRCGSCGYDWGPFVSPQVLRDRGEAHHYPELCGVVDEDDDEPGGQASLSDW